LPDHVVGDGPDHANGCRGLSGGSIGHRRWIGLWEPLPYHLAVRFSRNVEFAEARANDHAKALAIAWFAERFQTGPKGEFDTVCETESAPLFHPAEESGESRVA